MIDETLFDAEEKMEKAVSVSRDDLSTIRTGRANPSMFNRIVIDYYGSATPITQLASINVPEARLVVIKPYEAGQLGSIEAAIRNSDLGVNPTNDGTLIRVAVPQLTEER
ncbi:MAG TPA: ribosome-recycling factor, partial [Mycobacterium sp.]|nr:ribosome-recycling factor [Mycobacterium sp.]